MESSTGKTIAASATSFLEDWRIRQFAQVAKKEAEVNFEMPNVWLVRQTEFNPNRRPTDSSEGQ